MIGTNKKDAQETVDNLLADLDGGPRPRRRPADAAAVEELLAERVPEHVTYSGWEAIDRAEQERGEPLGRPRVKFVRIDEMLEAARSGVPVPRLIAMADLAEIERMIETALPGAEVEVVDETAAATTCGRPCGRRSSRA